MPVDGYNNHPNLLQESVNSSYSAGGRYRMTFWIPSDFTCSQCTLQFWYRTANSCTPDFEAYQCYFQNMENLGWDVQSFLGSGYYPRWQATGWDGKECPTGTAKETNVLVRKNNGGEQFKNCADVSVGSEGSGDSSGSQPAPNPPVTQPEPEPEPEPASPTPATPSAPTPATGALQCTGSGGCKAKCQARCNSQLATNQCWGTPRYVHCKCSDGSTHSFPGCDCQNGACPKGVVSATPEPEPEPEPETATPRRRRAASEPEPEPEPETATPRRRRAASPATGECADSAFTEPGWTHWTGQCSAFGIGDCAHTAVKNACCMCGGGSSLSQTKVGKVQTHRFLGARSSSMMEEWAERDIHDEPLFETPGPQDEL